jgi:hypothetical protein
MIRHTKKSLAKSEHSEHSVEYYITQWGVAKEALKAEQEKNEALTEMLRQTVERESKLIIRYESMRAFLKAVQ